MLWTYKGNKLTIYDVEINKKRLHAIQKRIIRKYGEVSDKFIWDREKMEKYAYSEKYEIKDFNIKVIDVTKSEYDGKKYDNVTFELILYPELAIIIEELLMKREKAVYKLFEYKNRNVDNSEKLGIEYIDEIFENVKLIPTYISTFNSSYEMLAKLMEFGDAAIRTTIKSIQRTMIPSDVITPGGNVKKIGPKK